jgi:hypothetical protein
MAMPLESSVTRYLAISEIALIGQYRDRLLPIGE